VANATVCNGAFQGSGTVCAPNPCAQPATGACCQTGNVCAVISLANCDSTGGTYRGDNTACAPNPCGATGACCDATGACTFGLQTACTGTFMATIPCVPNPCPIVGSCCRGTSCMVAQQSSCVGGRFGGAGSTCAAPTCCQADFNGMDGLTVQDLFDYLNAYLMGSSSAEFDQLPGLTLSDLFAFLEAFIEGCAPPPQNGSCCTGTACTEVASAAECVGGHFGGAGSTCPTPPNCCQADINNSGGLTVQDLFDYLDFWISGDPRADIDANPGVTQNDLFTFLALYLAGC
jgi:hypothetical protein